MTDETINDATVTEPETKAPDTQQAQKGKVFTQDELNAIVAKEKAAWKKSADREKETLSAMESSLRGDVAFYEEKFKAVIAVQTSDFDPVTLELFSALPIKEQLEKLSDEAFLAKVRRKNIIPETPKGTTEGKMPFKRTNMV